MTQLGGRQLLGCARTHAVVTDRPLDQGGTDVGFTSGEMLLLAIASCATGSVRNFLECHDTACDGIKTEVFYESVGGARDRIVISMRLPRDRLAAGEESLRAAALSGKVTGRVKLGSEIDVRLIPSA
jgi:hypothetical protein